MFADELERKVNALESLISAVNPSQIYNQSGVSQQLLQYLNTDSKNGEDINVFILSEEDIQTHKNQCNLLKEYVKDIGYIQMIHDAIVLPETKEKLKEHLDKIDCEVDTHAVTELYNDKMDEFRGGRKTRRQRRKRT